MVLRWTPQKQQLFQTGQFQTVSLLSDLSEYLLQIFLQWLLRSLTSQKRMYPTCGLQTAKKHRSLARLDSCTGTGFTRIF